MGDLGIVKYKSGSIENQIAFFMTSLASKKANKSNTTSHYADNMHAHDLPEIKTS